MTTLAFPEAERERALRLARLAERTDGAAGHRTGHSVRIAVLCERLARRLGVAQADLLDLKIAGLARGFGLHALGLSALERAGPITLAERAELWRHPLLAEQHLAKRGGSRHAQLLVRWHHEWWNGLGYPDMLAHDAIPLGARLLRIAETYEAMRSPRPHRDAHDEATARRYLAEAAGVEFDPDVAARFLEMLDEPEPADLAPDGLADLLPAGPEENGP